MRGLTLVAWRAAVAHVVLLAGGTGGAKLARGLLDELGSELTVIANTGDDVEIYGAHVSPDPDLVTFGSPTRSTSAAGAWPATPSRRWTSCARWARTSGSTSATATSRSVSTARAGSPQAARLTETIEDLRRAFGVPARVLVPSDEPLRTHILAGGRWHPFQEFMIRARPRVRSRTSSTAATRRPRRRPWRRCARRRTIIIGPSNPVLSIDPILSVLQHELHAATAPVIAVSPLVRGAVLKGPTADCLHWAGRTLDSDGIVDHYEGLIDALVADQRAEHVPTLETDVELSSPAPGGASRMKCWRSPPR